MELNTQSQTPESTLAAIQHEVSGNHPRIPRKPRRKAMPETFPALVDETRYSVSTACAAWHLGRKPQTLRGWACHEDGPVLPVRVFGRLAWTVSDLRREMKVAA